MKKFLLLVVTLVLGVVFANYVSNYKDWNLMASAVFGFFTGVICMNLWRILAKPF